MRRVFNIYLLLNLNLLLFISFWVLFVFFQWARPQTTLLSWLSSTPKVSAEGCTLSLCPSARWAPTNLCLVRDLISTVLLIPILHYLAVPSLHFVSNATDSCWSPTVLSRMCSLSLTGAHRLARNWIKIWSVVSPIQLFNIQFRTKFERLIKWNGFSGCLMFILVLCSSMPFPYLLSIRAEVRQRELRHPSSTLLWVDTYRRRMCNQLGFRVLQGFPLTGFVDWSKDVISH